METQDVMPSTGGSKGRRMPHRVGFRLRLHCDSSGSILLDFILESNMACRPPLTLGKASVSLRVQMPAQVRVKEV